MGENRIPGLLVFGFISGIIICFVACFLFGGHGLFGAVFLFFAINIILIILAVKNWKRYKDFYIGCILATVLILSLQIQIKRIAQVRFVGITQHINLEELGIISTKEACEAKGGHWGTFGLMLKEQCNLPTADEGKVCLDHSECESICIADDSISAGQRTSGKCYGRTLPLGTCLNYVKDGVAQGVLCVD